MAHTRTHPLGLEALPSQILDFFPLFHEMQRSLRFELASDPPLSKQLESKGNLIKIDSTMRLIARVRAIGLIVGYFIGLSGGCLRYPRRLFQLSFIVELVLRF